MGKLIHTQQCLKRLLIFAPCRQNRVVARMSSSESKLPPLFSLGKLNHVAIAVPDMEKSVKFYEEVLNASCSPIEQQPNHGVSTVFIHVGGKTAAQFSPKEFRLFFAASCFWIQH